MREARYTDADVDELARVYVVTWDGPIAFADGEVVAAEWLTAAELTVAGPRPRSAPTAWLWRPTSSAERGHARSRRAVRWGSPLPVPAR